MCLAYILNRYLFVSVWSVGAYVDGITPHPYPYPNSNPPPPRTHRRRQHIAPTRSRRRNRCSGMMLSPPLATNPPATFLPAPNGTRVASDILVMFEDAVARNQRTCDPMVRALSARVLLTLANVRFVTCTTPQKLIGMINCSSRLPVAGASYSRFVTPHVYVCQRANTARNDQTNRF
jgi:hypothetical protein